ncbi:hypothetical protein WMY93_030927 [Mugilogobius chulae]|uniref:Uncharacterized protein n=1 Tax=Mugilogobius chulae TaxID=88201 RepID=A0AAW0MES5_9GOBI
MSPPQTFLQQQQHQAAEQSGSGADRLWMALFVRSVREEMDVSDVNSSALSRSKYRETCVETLLCSTRKVAKRAGSAPRTEIKVPGANRGAWKSDTFGLYNAKGNSHRSKEVAQICPLVCFRLIASSLLVYFASDLFCKLFDL